MKSRKATAALVATYWTALLQDQLSLFVLRHRPFHLLEQSPRGRILVDIYNEAARRTGAGAGVPSSLIWPVPPSTAKAFRELAVLLPEPGWSGVAAVEGRWEGSFDQGGTNHELVVRLKSQGPQLGGSVTMRSSGITMDVPLQQASYGKDVLRFVMLVKGSPEVFKGTVEGEAISGTVTTNKQPVGRFNLRFIE